MTPDKITERVAAFLGDLPPGVTLVAAGKSRTPEELRAALRGGVALIGHNYVQEAEASIAALRGEAVRWHCIGHLQRNKARRAAELFDLIETVDSERLGEALERACAAQGKTLPILIEVNSAAEESKAGVLPDQVEPLCRALGRFTHLRVSGLMTMGPLSEDPEGLRQSFRLTRRLFEQLGRAELPGVEMRELSMGMSSSYQVAIEEGATLVRVGTLLFGPR